MRKLDHTNKRFGHLLVLHRAPIKTRNAYWICRCDCGRERPVCAGHLTSGAIISCGCIRAALVSDALTKHGHRRRHQAGGQLQTSEYSAWIGMKERCYLPQNAAYHYYGGRGITVCDRWRYDFQAFLADMGHKPSPSHSIDRINNDGPYAPDNCRWATKSQQAFNRRPKHQHTFPRHFSFTSALL